MSLIAQKVSALQSTIPWEKYVPVCNQLLGQTDKTSSSFCVRKRASVIPLLAPGTSLARNKTLHWRQRKFTNQTHDPGISPGQGIIDLNHWHVFMPKIHSAVSHDASLLLFITLGGCLACPTCWDGQQLLNLGCLIFFQCPATKSETQEELSIEFTVFSSLFQYRSWFRWSLSFNLEV